MSFGFVITDLQSSENSFSVNSRFGTWEFEKAQWYDKIITDINNGMTGNTFLAFNDSVTPSISERDFNVACTDLRNLCLLLSFQNAACVTPSGSSPGSIPQFLEMGDSFVPPRAIRGFCPLPPVASVAPFLVSGLSVFSGPLQKYYRLLLFHWISALTCYTLEDLFLAVCVHFDIVKQTEIAISGSNKTYFQGMEAASNRLGIPKLSRDYTKMRNDLVHEGQISGSNFPGKSKADCARVVADTLNWLDNYVICSLDATGHLLEQPRWKAEDFEHFLPAFSLS